MGRKILASCLRGISLTELLVAMAIIAILLSMLLMVVGKAVQAAHNLAGH